MFTFQYGRLKTPLTIVYQLNTPLVYIPIWTIKDRPAQGVSQLCAAFTFQYGRLKTAAKRRRDARGAGFTFQYGRLKTILCAQTKFARQRLHSNMDD